MTWHNETPNQAAPVTPQAPVLLRLCKLLIWLLAVCICGWLALLVYHWLMRDRLPEYSDSRYYALAWTQFSIGLYWLFSALIIAVAAFLCLKRFYGRPRGA